MADIDIIIPLYNKAVCVGRAIRSIQEQTYTDWRLIVVDDGSTDNGADIVRKFEDSRIELIQQPNQGPGAARNTGISHAKSKYIAFLDADDEWYPWYLGNSLKAIEDNDVAVVGTMYYEWPKKIDMTRYWAKQNIRSGKYYLRGNEDAKKSEALMLFFHVWNSLLLTEAARKYDGFYDKKHCKYGEDTVFFMRIVINEQVMIIDPPAIIHHREDSDLANVQNAKRGPMLDEPEIILNYSPREKHDLMLKIIAKLALRTAHHNARNGFKAEAVELLKRFPDCKNFIFRYWRCRYEIALSRWFPYWVKFKCVVGPATRSFFKSLAWKLHLLPKLPDSIEEKHKTGLDKK